MRCDELISFVMEAFQKINIKPNLNCQNKYRYKIHENYFWIVKWRCKMCIYINVYIVRDHSAFSVILFVCWTHIMHLNSFCLSITIFFSFVLFQIDEVQSITELTLAERLCNKETVQFYTETDGIFWINFF